MIITGGEKTSTHGIDIVVTFEVKIGPITPTWFDVPIVPIVEVTGGSGSAASFRAWEVFFGLTISTRILPLLRRI